MSDKIITGKGTDGSIVEVRTKGNDTIVRVDSNGDKRFDAEVTLTNGRTDAFYVANRESGFSPFGSVLSSKLLESLPGGLSPKEVTDISEMVKTIVMSAGPLPGPRER